MSFLLVDSSVCTCTCMLILLGFRMFRLKVLHGHKEKMNQIDYQSTKDQGLNRHIWDCIGTKCFVLSLLHIFTL